jgi:hypothetical protein
MNSQMKTLSEQFTNNIGILKWVHMFYWFIHDTNVHLIYQMTIPRLGFEILHFQHVTNKNDG